MLRRELKAFVRLKYSDCCVRLLPHHGHRPTTSSTHTPSRRPTPVHTRQRHLTRDGRQRGVRRPARWGSGRRGRRGRGHGGCGCGAIGETACRAGEGPTDSLRWLVQTPCSSGTAAQAGGDAAGVAQTPGRRCASAATLACACRKSRAQTGHPRMQSAVEATEQHQPKEALSRDRGRLPVKGRPSKDDA